METVWGLTIWLCKNVVNGLVNYVKGQLALLPIDVLGNAHTAVDSIGLLIRDLNAEFLSYYQNLVISCRLSD